MKNIFKNDRKEKIERVGNRRKIIIRKRERYNGTSAAAVIRQRLKNKQRPKTNVTTKRLQKLKIITELQRIMIILEAKIIMIQIATHLHKRKS